MILPEVLGSLSVFYPTLVMSELVDQPVDRR